MTGEKLTGRERQVLAAVVRGARTCPEVAEIAGVSSNSAQQYLARLTNRVLLRRIVPGEYSLALPKKKLPPAACGAVTETGIAPIPLHRLMGGR